ncbi:MAG: metallophosphoesterase, partial [Planctomycetota bacterium]
ELAPLLASLDAPLGKYAVTGNHEFYTGIKQAEAFHQRAGFILLRGRSTLVDGRLWIGGVDDPAGLRRSGGDVHLNEGEALPGKHRWVASVLLKHRPLVDPRSVGRFDLQLSGHVHGGQIFPFVLFVAMTDSLLPGSHTFDGSTVYVSRGAGTWGPPMRFLAPPAITVIDLAPAG